VAVNPVAVLISTGSTQLVTVARTTVDLIDNEVFARRQLTTATTSARIRANGFNLVTVHPATRGACDGAFAATTRDRLTRLHIQEERRSTVLIGLRFCVVGRVVGHPRVLRRVSVVPGFLVVVVVLVVVLVVVFVVVLGFLVVAFRAIAMFLVVVLVTDMVLVLVVIVFLVVMASSATTIVTIVTIVTMTAEPTVVLHRRRGLRCLPLLAALDTAKRVRAGGGAVIVVTVSILRRLLVITIDALTLVIGFLRHLGWLLS